MIKLQFIDREPVEDELLRFKFETLQRCAGIIFTRDIVSFDLEEKVAHFVFSTSELRTNVLNELLTNDIDTVLPISILYGLFVSENTLDITVFYEDVWQKLINPSILTESDTSISFSFDSKTELKDYDGLTEFDDILKDSEEDEEASLYATLRLVEDLYNDVLFVDTTNKVTQKTKKKNKNRTKEKMAKASRKRNRKK